MTELHMYEEGEDWVIAYDEEDATECLEELHGGGLGELVWKKLDPKESFTFFYDRHPGEDTPPGRRALKVANHPEWKWSVKATVAEWIELRGHGWFAGTDW